MKRTQTGTNKVVSLVAHAAGQGANAKIYQGPIHSISIDVSNSLLRIHDDTTPGGWAVVQLMAPSAVVGPVWPFQPAATAVPLPANSPHVVTHNFGRKPIVQVIDLATGEVIEPEIKHIDLNSFQVVVSAPIASAEIIYQ